MNALERGNDLRAIKERLLDENDALSQIRDHVTLLTDLYEIDPESAFAARLDISECTSRAAAGICAALWPFYVSPDEDARPAQPTPISLNTSKAGASP